MFKDVISSYLSLCSCTFPVGDSRPRAQTLGANASYRGKTLCALSEITRHNENTRCLLILQLAQDEQRQPRLVR